MCNLIGVEALSTQRLCFSRTTLPPRGQQLYGAFVIVLPMVFEWRDINPIKALSSFSEKFFSVSFYKCFHKCVLRLDDGHVFRVKQKTISSEIRQVAMKE